MSFKQIARDAANREANTGEDSIGLIVRNAASNTKNKTKGLSKINLPSFDEGGTVPGDEGQPKLIVAHGQEEVLPTEEAEQYRALKPLGLNTEKQNGGIGRVQMDDPNSTEPATISTQELGIPKPQELISTKEKEEKPEATGGTVIADRWLKRNGLAAPTDSAIPQGVTAPKELNQGGPGFKPMVLPPDTTTAPAATETIPTGRSAYKAKIADYDKQHQDLMDKAASTNDPQYAEQAARVTEAKLAYEKQHPWGSPESAHPGILGRIGHIGEEIASRTPFGVSAIAGTVPGSEGYRAAQGRNAQEQVKESSAQNVAEVEKDTPEQKTTRALLEKGYTLGKDEKGNTVLNEVPGFRDSSKDMQALLASTVQDEVAAGRDPMQSSTVQRIMSVMQSVQKPEKPEHEDDKEKYAQQYLKDNKLPDTATNRDKAYAAFAKANQAPEHPTLMLVPDGKGGYKAINVQAGATVSGEAVKPGEPAQASSKAIVDHDKAYVQPANAVEKSYDMMDHAYREYEDARAKGKDLPTGAQSMVALSTHLSTTFGNVKGARITKDMIQEHLGARGVSDKALVAFQKLSNGDVLSPDQWEAFHSLISESRTLSWQTAVREAERKHVPINFLPDDLTAVKVPGHAASTIHTSQLQKFQKDFPNAVVLSEKE
jgi:hypothetical protein